ncbi:MAG: DNA polymerase III subunit alpha [Chloroflexota bacterium]|nr:DNA polymerase III subunit alpha [Chloroflexota bacterium]
MFTHLHLHTEYSLLDGLSRIPDVMDRVAAIGQTSVAMTDHGALYGTVDFYKEARARGIKPIIGIEAYIAPDSRLKKSDSRANNYFHLTLLARDMEGYRNLIQLSTKSHLEGFYYKPRMDKELLAAHGKGIIALSGCPSGEMHKLLLEDRYDEAKALAGFFGDVFDDFYLEVMKHDEPEINAQCEKVMRGLVTLSRETSVPLVATNDSHYTVQADASIHDVLLCIGTNSTVDDPKRQLKMHDTSYYVKSEDEMLTLFPETPEAVTNTQLVADQCNLDLEFGRLHLPEPEVPAGVTAHEYLTSLAREGLNRRYPFADDAVRDRLQYELDVVEKTGFTSYFLVVHDVAQFCQRQDIMLGVRGSAAASIILYALDVTFIDPLALRLVFERFLHVDRKEPPDVDFDIPDDRRDEVIRYVAEKYGYDRVAQIITFGTMGAKAAVRDTGRALGMAYGDVDRVARLVPNALHITLTKALDESPELASAYELDPQVSRLIDTARRLEGVARHASTHAAGVVISREPLVEYVPLQRSPRGDESSIPTTQFAMSQVAEIGLLKMDFLGLANLTILGRAVKIIERTKGIKIDLAALPDHDEKTYEMLGRGDTFGVFQLESPGMRRLIQELRPDSIADLMALVALYRPGPMAHIGTYCRAKHDRSLVQYPHPDLAEILDETYGVIAYQDQVLFVLQKFAGYDLKDADAIRKAMSKKIAALMQAEGGKFVAASIINGYSEQEARAIFDLILPFAGYAFNKAHSAVYGTIAYQTGYLKANYPHEYMTAVLSSAGAHERIAQAVAECVRIGVAVRAPDVNSSGATFELHEIDPDGVVADAEMSPTSNIQHPTSNRGVPTVCFGLGTVKNVGIGAAECIIEARDAGGPFASIEDFTKRVDMKALNKRALESLVKCGALDALARRGMLLGNIDRIVSLAQREAKLKETGQSTMFDMFGDSVATPLSSLELVEYEISKAEMLAWEKELLGVYVSEHPFTSAAVTIAKHTSALVSEITAEMDGRDVVIAGMVNGIRSLTTKAGKLFVAVTVEDLSGSTEVTVWTDVYEPTRDLWAPGNILLMLVRVRERADRLQSSVQQVSLVQAADGSFSHEQFGIPPWLTDAVRATAGVAVRLLPAGDERPATSDQPPPTNSALPLPAFRFPSPADARSAPGTNAETASNGATSDASDQRLAAALQPPTSNLQPPTPAFRLPFPAARPARRSASTSTSPPTPTPTAPASTPSSPSSPPTPATMASASSSICSMTTRSSSPSPTPASAKTCAPKASPSSPPTATPTPSPSPA